MLPAVGRTDDIQSRTTALIEAIYVHISTRRETTDILNAAGMICWLANVSEGSDNPSQTLDALAVDSRAYSNKNILIMEPLAVPPMLGAGDLLSVIPSEEIITSKHTYQASRKIDRSQQVLCMMLNSDVSSVLNCFVQFRVLLSYGAR